MHTTAASLSVSKIGQCLGRTRDLLESSRVVADGAYGWRQYLDEGGAPGTYGTACGLIAYSHVPNARTPDVVEVAQTIAAKQLEDGSWASPTIVDGVGLTTATAYSLMAIQASRCPIGREVYSKAQKWLEEIIQADGATPDFRGHTGYNTTSAAMVLRATQHLDAVTLKQRVVSWLLSSRCRGGGWGYLPNGESTVDHTALSIIGLVSAGYPLDSIEMAEAIDYLRSAYAPGNPENNHRNDQQYVPDEQSQRMLPFHYFTDGLVGIAYLLMRPQYDLLPEARAIADHLVRSQTDEGYWVHAAIPEKHPSWAVSEAVSFLSRAKAVLAEEGRLSDLEQWRPEVNDALTKMQQQLDQVESRTRGIPMAIRILRLWPFHMIYAGIIVYILVRFSVPASPWVDIFAVMVGVVASIVAGAISFRKGQQE